MRRHGEVLSESEFYCCEFIFIEGTYVFMGDCVVFVSPVCVWQAVYSFP